MKKTSLFLAAFLFVAGSLFSHPISEKDARTIAQNFFRNNSSIQFRSISSDTEFNLAYVANAPIGGVQTRGVGSNSVNYFYVFNIGKDKGFVIVSGDTRAKSVLGYSDAGHFDKANIPDNMQSWLNGYITELKFAIENLPESRTTRAYSYPETRGETSFPKSVSPLLGKIVHHQDAPYHNLCPKMKNGKPTKVGCVATAMVQVMLYHKWPKQGKGSKSYTSERNKFNLSANFGNTNYDWDNVLPFYTKAATNVQKTAVATICSHAGIAVEMDYGDDGSGAGEKLVPQTLFEYFGYDAGMQYFDRSFFSNTDWINMLKTEFSQKRPVIYSAANQYLGHAFVLDGYDEKDKFHVNWGWGGDYNGFYELSTLTPVDENGNEVYTGFVNGHAMTTGIQKSVSGSQHRHFLTTRALHVSSKKIDKTKDLVDFALLDFVNSGVFSYSGTIGIALIDKGGKMTLLAKEDIEDFVYEQGEPGVTNDRKFTQISFSKFPAGDYTIRPVFLDSKNKYVPIVTKSGYGNGVIDVKISASLVEFSSNNITAYLGYAAEPAVSGKLINSKEGIIDLKIVNKGWADYDGEISVYLVQPEGEGANGEGGEEANYGFQSFKPLQIKLKVGETKAVRVKEKITVKPGKYQIVAEHEFAGKGHGLDEFQPVRFPAPKDLCTVYDASEKPDDPAAPVEPEEPTVNEIKLLSNPVQSSLKMHFTKGLKEISVYNLLGGKVKSLSVSDEGIKDIPVYDLMPGIYIVTVCSDDGSVYKTKIIKK